MSQPCSFIFVSVDLKNCHLFQISLVGFIKVSPSPVYTDIMGLQNGHWTSKMAQFVKCMLHKHGDPSSIPDAYESHVWQCVSVTLVLEARRQGLFTQ